MKHTTCPPKLKTMRRRNLWCTLGITIITLSLLTGCAQTNPEQVNTAQETQSFKYTDTCLTELCVCQAINPDGSILLWGEREEDGKFFAYSVVNTLGLERGDDVALSYDEEKRKRAKTRDKNTYIVYLLQSGTYELEEITPNLIRQAVNGARKNKYIKQMEQAEAEADESGSSIENTKIAPNGDKLLAEGEESPEKKPDAESVENTGVIDEEATDIKEKFVINTNKVSPNDHIDITVQQGKNYRVDLNGRVMLLDNTFQYCWAEDIYELTDDTYLGTTRETPSKGDILLYINSSVQFQAGMISDVSPTPDGGYLIGFTPVPLNILIRK